MGIYQIEVGGKLVWCKVGEGFTLWIDPSFGDGVEQSDLEEGHHILHDPVWIMIRAKVGRGIDADEPNNLAAGAGFFQHFAKYGLLHGLSKFYMAGYYTPFVGISPFLKQKLLTVIENDCGYRGQDLLLDQARRKRVYLRLSYCWRVC